MPDVQVGFRKGRHTRDHVAHICWLMGCPEEFQKKISLYFLRLQESLDCIDGGNSVTVVLFHKVKSPPPYGELMKE